MRRVQGTPIERLLSRCIEDDNGCWLFTGAKSFGYGVVGKGRRGEGTILAHRLTYSFFIADPPPGLDLDHLCRVRACCNPWHVEPVTRQVNVDRGLGAKGRRQITHCKHGHEFTPENTGKRKNQRRCLACVRDRYHEKQQARKQAAA